MVSVSSSYFDVFSTRVSWRAPPITSAESATKTNYIFATGSSKVSGDSESLLVVPTFINVTYDHRCRPH